MEAYLATRLIQFMRPVFFHCFFFRSCSIQFTSEQVSFLKSKTSFREFLFVIFGFLRRGTHFFFGRHGARRRVGFTCGSLIFRPISTAFSTCFLFSFILMNFRAVPSVCVCVCVCFGVGVGSFLLRLRQGRPGPSFFSFFFCSIEIYILFFIFPFRFDFSSKVKKKELEFVFACPRLFETRNERPERGDHLFFLSDFLIIFFRVVSSSCCFFFSRMFLVLFQRPFGFLLGFTGFL